ncbi:MAG: S41 family peptidase [Muribaculaceae bacterium]|nr:S41 family peptidase [Muribaculaceae bacterium]
MKRNKLYPWIPLLFALTFVAGVAAALLISPRKAVQTPPNKLDSVISLITAKYVDTLDIDSIIETAIPEILSNLDPHTVYIPSSDLQAVNEDLDGSFSGIGISFTIQNDTVTVIETIAGGPAERVGLVPGDRIVEIDGRDFTGKKITNDSVMNNLRGPRDTQVTLGIKRSSSPKTLSFDIIRGDIPVNSVVASYIIDDGVGYIKVDKFGRTTFDEFFQALIALSYQGAKDFIIDLRGNGGGFMEIAIMMANEFLDRGDMIVFTRGRDGRDESFIAADGNGTFKTAGVTVLIDEYSASASEIFAGAIQDNDRGWIIGRRSFGKGLIQQQFDLPDSSAIRLTIARYYTPSGRSIQKDYSDSESYSYDIISRYERGEAFSADSMQIDKSLEYTTTGGRTVYGGGGIIPDLFVPNDTTGISNYYIKVANAGLLQKFAFSYADTNREKLSRASDVTELLKLLPPDYALIDEFVAYCVRNGIPAQWYYIKQSRDLIVTQLKALIARDAIGMSAYFEIFNTIDKTVDTALSTILDSTPLIPYESPEAVE